MTHGRKDIKIGISVRVRKPYCPHLLNLSHPISFYQCKIGRRIKTGLSLVSEPVTMVDNLRAEGRDNAETERTLAERLHKLTTLENKEVMSDSKIDQLANLVKVLRKKESPLKAVVFKKAHGCGLPILDLKVLFNPKPWSFIFRHSRRSVRLSFSSRIILCIPSKWSVGSMLTFFHLQG